MYTVIFLTGDWTSDQIMQSWNSTNEHPIYLISAKQLPSYSECRTQVFGGFSGHGNSINNVIPLFKKKKMYI